MRYILSTKHPSFHQRKYKFNIEIVIYGKRGGFDMELGFAVINKTLITSINGDVDHHTCINIRQNMDKYIEKNSIKNIIFDFKNVGFMDSSGIGVVIGRYKNVNRIGGRVSIVNLTPIVKRIFEISGLFKIIDQYENIDSAVENMQRWEMCNDK